jgi:hypothetical protein
MLIILILAFIVKVARFSNPQLGTRHMNSNMSPSDTTDVTPVISSLFLNLTAGYMDITSSAAFGTKRRDATDLSLPLHFKEQLGTAPDRSALHKLYLTSYTLPLDVGCMMITWKVCLSTKGKTDWTFRLYEGPRRPSFCHDVLDL